MAICALYRIFDVKIFRNLYPASYFCSKAVKKLDYKKCYEILEIPEGSDQEHIRQAYLMLVKKHHPDSGDGNVDKFQEVDKAFKMLMDKKARERWDVEDVPVEEQDIKHTAPQHRQYLSFEGVGAGNVFQREKQYTKVRAMRAAINVLQHRMQKVVAEEKAVMHKTSLKHKIKTKYGYERLVEDLIQEAMSRGEFSNLSGSGKPLKGSQNKNPYVDFVTHKINEVLIENGFTPEWITLQKEIRHDLNILRESLLSERRRIGPLPLSTGDELVWKKIMEKHAQLVSNINKKINKFNLVVPVLNKQMFLINMTKESQRALKLGKNNTQVPPEERHKDYSHPTIPESESSTLFGFIDRIFNQK